jgi:hypothetical protein
MLYVELYEFRHREQKYTVNHPVKREKAQHFPFFGWRLKAANDERQMTMITDHSASERCCCYTLSMLQRVLIWKKRLPFIVFIKGTIETTQNLSLFAIAPLSGADCILLASHFRLSVLGALQSNHWHSTLPLLGRE